MRMIMMRTGNIPDRRVEAGAMLAITLAMTMAGVRRTHRVVRKRAGKRRGKKMGRGMGRGRGRQWRKGRRREMVKRKVLLNKPQGEMISRVPLFCGCRG
jgi:hypothetical protein